jgi:triosephosphate isomerase (TIM)
MAATKPLIAGNWKMNGLLASISELDAILSGARSLENHVELLVCPPATLVAGFAAAAIGSGVRIGAQDCHADPKGAHTGDISAEMLADCGAAAVIVGHSERRADHGETDAVVRAKAQAAFRAGLMAIICVGESRAEREAGQALEVVSRQIAGSVPADAPAASLVIAYEPIWAIGTGLIPTMDEIAEMHAAIRTLIAGQVPGGEEVRVLYGGSVKPDNAAEVLAVPGVGGALVGGASLKAADFLAIASAVH